MRTTFVVVAGCLGAGKSTLISSLCARNGWEPYFEPVTENPFLERFYADERRWAFHSQLFFLASRLQDHARMLHATGTVVQDRCVWEDRIFAEYQHRQGNIADHDWALYTAVHDATSALLPRPHLVVYLRASTDALVARIAERNRSMEQHIPRAYVDGINALYEEWARTFTLGPVLTIETDGRDHRVERDLLATEQDILRALRRR